MDPHAIPTIDVSELPNVIPSDVVVLDVREDFEWIVGHIEGATHIPLGELQSRVSELDPTARTIVVCHMGGRSSRATTWLQGQGHDATNLAGGMEAWEATGRPVVT